MNEQIDESQWLPKGTPIVNAFRAAHKGIIYDGKSIKNLTWLPDILHYKIKNENGHEMLTRDELHTCEVVQRSVLSTRQFLGISDLRVFVLQNYSNNPHPKNTDLFFVLIRDLLPYQSNLLLWLICDEYNRSNVALASHLINSIRNVLDLAQKIIEKNKEPVNIPIVALPEVSSQRPIVEL